MALEIKSKLLRFLVSAFVWAVFTCGPAVGLAVKSTPTGDEVWSLVFLLFASAVEAGLLWSLTVQTESRFGAAKVGAVLGFLVPTVWGYLLAKDLASFDAQGFIAVGLLIGISSGIGGGFAGSIQWQAEVHHQIRRLRSEAQPGRI